MTTEDTYFERGSEWVRPTIPLSESEVEFLGMIISSTIDTFTETPEWPEMEGLIFGVLVDQFNRQAKAIQDSGEFPDFRFSNLEDIRALSPDSKYVYVAGAKDQDKKNLDEQLINSTLFALAEFENYAKLST